MPRTKAIATADSDSAGDGLTSKYRQFSDSDKGMILWLTSQGMTQTEIARRFDCAQSSISEFLQRVGNPAAVVQKVLKSHELDAAQEWSKAMRVAAKRGDHRPARELIEAANPELRPQQGHSGSGVGVQVIIGMPGSPVQLPTIEVSPIRPQLESETSADH